MDLGAHLIPEFIAPPGLGELLRPARFLPVIDWDHLQVSYAYGPAELGSGNSDPDMSKGNYQYGWVAYLGIDGVAYLQRKIINGLWDGNDRYLLALTAGIKRMSIDFAVNGTVVVAYINADDGLGIWWRDPETTLNSLMDLGTVAQDCLLSVENKDDQQGTDIFLWYFRSGNLYLRTYSERFATEHGPYVEGLTNPSLIQAGINHRYAYQVDYRDESE